VGHSKSWLDQLFGLLGAQLAKLDLFSTQDIAYAVSKIGASAKVRTPFALTNTSPFITYHLPMRSQILEYGDILEYREYVKMRLHSSITRTTMRDREG
jgi:hypothetical protein